MAQLNVIIVAGGKGLRMGGELPKQFIEIGGKPILMHTIDAFFRFDSWIRIILVLPESHREYWQELCQKYNYDVPHVVTIGGETRFHSVKNGLALVDDGLVAVHDGARPFASEELIGRCFLAARDNAAAIPVVDATDSLRQIQEDGKSKIIDRSKIKQVQTPQVFSVVLLKKAYEQEFSNIFTDDASVVETLGQEIKLVQGEITNIKVTTPIDLKIGELILGKH
ncbi:2-C-methyl-D-erythritol 4-phosphate cytidylyltransferase [Dysgonomonas massiliensis]|uniref:2-C-methyl-D-erythritol 4-phosphate cytidylyltransferase n=1 Tax=Dysgonomonas massiliensis TaxID=2040292 RepID=UPI000C77577F|nr:2-C-methyl-D-erythritol 4-phosphate cytidylyltransferase [Dysgonomonas massiliensis]